MVEGKLSIKQNIMWNSAGSITYLGCQWLTTILVVRLSSGYDAAGVLALAMSIGNLFTPFAIYKMRTFQVSDVNHEYSAGQYFGFRLVTVLLAFVGCMAYALLTCQPETYLCVALYLAYKAVDIVIDVFHGVDQQHMRMDYIGTSLILRGIASLASFALVLWATNSLEAAVASMIVVTLPVGIFYDYRKASQFEVLRPQINRKLISALLVKCLPAVVAAISCSAVLTVPRQYLSVVSGDAALGIYASVAAPVVIVQMGATYIYNPLLGLFSDSYDKRDRAEFKRLFSRTTLGIVLIALGGMVVFQLFGGWALSLLYGESIAPYVYLLQPIILCTILTAYLWFISDLLVSIRDFKGNLVGNLAAIVCAIPLSYVCVNIWDMNGVSFTGILSFGIGIVVLCGFLLRDFRRAFPVSEEGRADANKGEG